MEVQEDVAKSHKVKLSNRDSDFLASIHPLPLLVMQTLSRREENEVVDIARKQAHKLCDDVVRGQSRYIITVMIIVKGDY